MSSKTITLKIFRSDDLVDTKSLTQDVIKIGKLKSSHLCLDDDAVARMHAVIEVSGSDVRVIDLGSSTGTVLNGAAIDKNAVVGQGDVLTFGPYRVEISEIADAVAAAPAPTPVASAAAPAAAAAPVAAAAPRVAAATAPPVQVDVGSVEVQDGRQVAEVVAMYGTTALDVAHVGQTKNRKKTAPIFMAVGGLMLVSGLALFGMEVTQDWETYSQELREARQAKKPEPQKPGYGTNALGLGLALLGLIPFVAGAMRMGERSVIDYTIGEGHGAVFHVPPHGLPDKIAFPLVRSSNGEFTLNFTPGMTGEVTLDNQTLSLQELVSSGRAGGPGAYHTFPLPRGVQGKVNYDDITFHINTVNPGAIVAGRGDVDWPFWAYVGGTAVIAITFYLLMRSIPDDLLAISMEDGDGEPAYARFMHQPDETKEEEPPPEEQADSDDSAGGTGQRHKGEEGKMGKPSSKSKSGLYAMKGPKNAVPQMARNFDPDMAARNAGILGVMQQQGGHFLASPYGGAFAVGNDDEDVWGGLTGSEVGEAYGVGGLGLVGTGRGGGGTGEGTIGLGNTGLIGKGGGGGSGSGYGRGAGAGFGGKGKRVPKVRQAKAKVQGALDRDIIRRIVRAHINEVRSCYNAGLTKNPNLQGRVAVNFVITGTGKVGSAVVQESTIKDKSVGNCIAKAVKRWKFPKPRGGGNVIVTYPFNLSPG
ncbi:FHA/TonB domain protein [Plesiocystis pacifica SIR-1]|uniref:FHA/TonB domain protein n=1 Tax=Plesiocystis pacifica SIR-1 TaxID=391625 RepID=A6GIF3_9BACT|nr:TonB family protein [Plesiocystis pacifica]EDM74364.1 FHA/TonB domain protein [Plesiocystis pacifica SIR-1]